MTGQAAREFSLAARQRRLHPGREVMLQGVQPGVRGAVAVRVLECAAGVDPGLAQLRELPFAAACHGRLTLRLNMRYVDVDNDQAAGRSAGCHRTTA